MVLLASSGFFEWCRINAVALQSIGSVLQGSGALLAAIVLAKGLDQLLDNRHSKSFDFFTDIFYKFYNLDKIDKQMRTDMEYNFERKLAPVIEKWLVYPESLNDAEQLYLAEFDALLNFFQIIVHASADKRLLGGSNLRDIMFTFWFILMKDDDHCVLRRYFLQSFHALRKKLRFDAGPALLAVYGTLRGGQGAKLDPAIRKAMGPKVGACALPGTMYALQAEDEQYPGFIPDKGTESDFVVGELYALGNDRQAATILRALDIYEEFQPSNLKDSTFVRKFIPIYTDDRKTRLYAWVYVYNQSIHLAERIPDGDWVPFAASLSPADL